MPRGLGADTPATVIDADAGTAGQRTRLVRRVAYTHTIRLARIVLIGHSACLSCWLYYIVRFGVYNMLAEKSLMEGDGKDGN